MPVMGIHLSQIRKREEKQRASGPDPRRTAEVRQYEGNSRPKKRFSREGKLRCPPISSSWGTEGQREKAFEGKTAKTADRSGRQVAKKRLEGPIGVERCLGSQKHMAVLHDPEEPPGSVTRSLEAVMM